MKKGIVYIEALMASIISLILIFSVSRLIFVSSEILKSNREKGRALDILRGVGELYKGDRFVPNGLEKINLDNLEELFSYPNENKAFTLYVESLHEEKLDIIKMRLISNEKRFEDVHMVVAK